MCTFITAIVPTETALPQLRELCDKYGFDVAPMDNLSLRTVVPDGYQFLPMRGPCNCDTALGYSSSSMYQMHNLQQESSKLKRKGWSAAKIARWKTDKARAPQQKKAEKDSELRQWERWIGEVVRSRTAKNISIILHLYDGSIDTDRISIKSIENINIDGLNAEKLANLDWDILYKFSGT